jgi:predicted transcriptional regulator
MNRLTPAEEQVMLRLWKLEKASVKEIVELYQDLKQVPAYNTTSTIIRILEKKKFVKHKAKGRGYIYLPKISKEEYGAYLINYLVTNYFNEDKSLLTKKINEMK